MLQGVAATFAAIALVAQGGGMPAVSMTPETVTRVVERYDRWVDGVPTLTAGGKAWVGAPGEKTRTFRFSLVAARPDRVRLQGRWGNLTTLFDLAARDGSWTFFLPREHAVVRSTSVDASAGLVVPPGELFTLLLPETVDASALVERGAWSVEGRLARLVLPPDATGRDGARHRVLWVDVDTGVLRKLELREASQLEAPALVATYDDVGDPPFATRVRVETADGAWASFQLDMVKLGETIDARRFSILIPPGTREVRPDDIPPDFLPEAEDGK